MFFRHSFPLAPLVDNGAPGNRSPQRLANTGTTESSTSRRLTEGKMHLLLVGSAGVRVRFSATGGLASAVDPARDVVYGPWSQVPFTADTGALFVYAEAADGAAAYECFVVQFQS